MQISGWTDVFFGSLPKYTSSLSSSHPHEKCGLLLSPSSIGGTKVNPPCKKRIPCTVFLCPQDPEARPGYKTQFRDWPAQVAVISKAENNRHALARMQASGGGLECGRSLLCRHSVHVSMLSRPWRLRLAGVGLLLRRLQDDEI